MKKVVIASVLAIATSTLCPVPAAFAQAPGAPASSPQAPSAPAANPQAPAAAPGQITIKDPAEYNAYSNAIGQSTPAAKAAAIEDFLQKYPQSVVKVDMLQQLLVAYQGSNDTTNMLKTAKLLLAADPNNLRAAFVYVYLTKAQASQKAQTDPAGAQPMFDDAANVATAALKVTAPTPGSGVSQADFDKLKTATTPIFYSAIATDNVGKKNYKDAIDNYKAELKAYPDPTATTTGPALNDTYLLGTAYVQEDPKDLPDGIFYLERAAQYAPPAAKDNIEKAAEYWYQKYHGSMEGFDPIKQLAHDNVNPPDSYKPVAAPPPPSPETLAHNALYPPPPSAGAAAPPPTDIKSMALTDKEFVLANGNQQDADAVWATMKGVRTEVPGVVIQGMPDSVQLAVSPDAQQSKTADFTINFSKPLAAAPTVGSSVKYVATFDSYTKTPPMIIMNLGEAPAAEKKAPARPAHRRPAAHH